MDTWSISILINSSFCPLALNGDAVKTCLHPMNDGEACSMERCPTRVDGGSGPAGNVVDGT